MSNDYLDLIDKILVKKTAIVKETDKTYKVYLPTNYNEIWEKIRKEKQESRRNSFPPKRIHRRQDNRAK